MGFVRQLYHGTGNRHPNGFAPVLLLLLLLLVVVVVVVVDVDVDVDCSKLRLCFRGTLRGVLVQHALAKCQRCSGYLMQRCKSFISPKVQDPSWLRLRRFERDSSNCIIWKKCWRSISETLKDSKSWCYPVSKRMVC